MNESQYQRLLDLFEPIVEWDEEINGINIFRETPTCIHYLLFRLWAPVWTRQYYVALTDKRMVILRLPRSGYIDYQKHFSVNYGEVSLDLYDYNGIIGINLINPPKTLSLKFLLFQKQKDKDEYLTKLIGNKNNHMA